LQKYPSLPTEELLARSPEVIIHSAAMGMDIETQREIIRRKWEKWQQIPAVKNKRIYIINPDTVQRLGPRLPSGINTVARCLHNPSALEQEYKVFADTDSEN
jgi:iron complex transport system substrate-binding protein